jgi:NTE family protein
VITNNKEGFVLNNQNLKNVKQEENLRDKLGLALSGGGFRASFFHIGVLAQMAMLGLLRYVEVISTVSGGSIIGALYYLHVKKLLEKKEDNKIDDKDFLNIVKAIEVDFLKAVQRNIRMKTFSNPFKNIRMSKSNYSRSDRLGELYDKYFYRQVIDENRKTMIQMQELKILPGGKDFSPRKDNIHRKKAKVPILLLNATSLNTGHNWRFEATRMGEPPRKDDLAKEIDKNFRLRRPDSYDNIIDKQQNVELGLAVAASACVPGLFHPLAISGLYQDKIRVQLVDGGVHDNQGIQGLLDEDCTMFVVSDASGQMGDEPDPSTGIAPVVFRSNSILMDRVREEQIFRLFQKYNPKDRPIALMHLQKGIEAEAKSWIGPDGKPAKKTEKERQPKIKSKNFGVAESVQKALSRIRTDLDSFTEVEAWSLMLDGYKMSQDELQGAKGIRDLIRNKSGIKNAKWDFLAIESWMENPTSLYHKHLTVAKERVFKVFRLSKPVMIVTTILAVIILAGLGILFRKEIINLYLLSVTLGPFIIIILVLLLGLIPKFMRLLKLPGWLISLLEFPVNFVVRGILPALGSLFVKLHLWIFDPLFKMLGRVSRLGQQP